MSIPLRYAFIGEAKQRKIAAKIESALCIWRAKWFPTLDGNTIETSLVVTTAVEVIPDAVQWSRIDSDAAMVGWIGSTAGDLNRMTSFLAGDTVVPDAGTETMSLGSLVMLPIADALTLTFGHPMACTPTADLPDDGSEARLKACYYTVVIDWGLFKWHGRLLPEAMDTLVGATKGTASSLPQRVLYPVAAAVDPERVVTVSLEIPGHVSLDDIADLKAGQVVLLDHGLSALWSIEVSGGDLLGHGSLGRADHHFAVQVVSSLSP